MIEIRGEVKMRSEKEEKKEIQEKQEKSFRFLSKSSGLIIVFLTLLISSLFLFQNCSDVNLKGLSENALTSCDPSLYDISREVRRDDLGNAVYFLRLNNRDISREYEGDILWFVNGDLQGEDTVWDNRLHLNCENHPPSIQVKARFMTSCGEEIETIEDFEYPLDICEEEPEPTPEPAPSGGDYCEEYKAMYPEVVNVPGFTTGLEAIDGYDLLDLYECDGTLWNEVCHYPFPRTFSDFIAPEPSEDPLTRTLPSGRTYMKFPQNLRGESHGGDLWQVSPFDPNKGNIIIRPGMRGKYLAIPLSIPADTPFNVLRLYQSGQGYQQTERAPVTIMISPCKGDFSSMAGKSNGLGEEVWIPSSENALAWGRGKYGKGHVDSFSYNFTHAKGKTIWVNITFHTFEDGEGHADYENGGYYTCPDNGKGEMGNPNGPPGSLRELPPDQPCGFYVGKGIELTR